MAFQKRLQHDCVRVQLTMLKPWFPASWWDSKRPSLRDLFLVFFSLRHLLPHLSSQLITERQRCLISNVHLTFSDLLFQSPATHRHTRTSIRAKDTDRETHTHTPSRTHTQRVTHSPTHQQFVAPDITLCVKVVLAPGCSFVNFPL